MIQPGTLLLGKYRIERVIGEGGMGVVALAHHLQLDQPVAIKFLLPQVLENAEVVQRFLREAQAAVKLRSEHVARVVDVGTLETGAPYMVMEYLDGMDLGQLLRQQGPLASGLAVDLMLQACEALAEAHSLGIVHRDIKPSNFFITRRPSGAPLLKVLDFGISKSPVNVDEGITSTQAVMGTPAYMSPEQMRSTKHVDARSDIWALGVVLYEVLCSRRPFGGETFSALCLQVAMDPTPPLDVPLPPGLAQVVARCMEKNPDDRFRNVAELAQALAPFARTATQAAASTERTAGVLGVSSGLLNTLPSASSHGTGANPVLGHGVGHGTGPNPIVGHQTGPRGYGTGGMHVATPPTTMGASSGELGALAGRRSRLGVVFGVAGAVLALAVVLMVFAGGDEAAGPAVPATVAPADPAAKASDQAPDEVPDEMQAKPADEAAGNPAGEAADQAAAQAAGQGDPDAGVAAAASDDADGPGEPDESGEPASDDTRRAAQAKDGSDTEASSERSRRKSKRTNRRAGDDRRGSSKSGGKDSDPGGIFDSRQ